MDPANRLLQIIHVSDIHLASAQVRRKRSAPSRRLLATIERRIPKLQGLRESVQQGLYGHEPEALRKLAEAIKGIASAEEPKQSPTWLVVTGDLTTWGEGAQIRAALKWLQNLSKECGFQSHVLYGNHDVWAEKFPLQEPTAYFATNRTNMRNRYFKSRIWPEGQQLTDPTCPFPIELFSLNTVMHERIQNFYAYGQVREDWYWEPLMKSANDQSNALAAAVKEYAGEVRLLATHHPVFMPPSSAFGMELLDAQTVVETVEFHSAASSPAFRIVLSGHTHSVFPDFSKLPDALPVIGAAMSPLSAEQVQLIVGTASQVLGRRAGTQTFQVLRFYGSSNPRFRVRLERLVYSRNNGVGPYQPICDPDDSSATAEEMFIP